MRGNILRVTITLLSYEHGILRQVLDVLGEAAKRGTVGKYRRELPSFVEFFQEFMDQYHHGKEENFIFPLASTRSGEMRRVADRLIAEHRYARALADDMKMLLDRDELSAFSKVSAELVRHMQGHIQEEENKVFPAIENIMSSDDDLRILEQYNAFSERRFDKDYLIRMEEFANRVQDLILGPGYQIGIRG